MAVSWSAREHAVGSADTPHPTCDELSTWRHCFDLDRPPASPTLPRKLHRCTLTSARYSRRVAAISTGNSHRWNPTIGGTRLGTCGRVHLDGPRLPRRLSAYHEAAHAVVAWKLGCTVERIDITAAAARGGQCVHTTPGTYRVPGSRRIPGTSFRQETTEQERATMAIRQRDVSTATAALAGLPWRTSRGPCRRSNCSQAVRP